VKSALVTLTVTTLSAVLLAGCGGDDSGGGSAPDGTTQGSYGDTQETTWEGTSGPATIRLTVAEPREGSPEDLQGLETGTDTAGMVPWYVDVSYELVEGETEPGILPSVTVTDTEENPGQGVFLSGSATFEPCPPEPLDAQPPRPGETVEGCTLVLLDEGATPGVTWFYPAEEGDSLTWE